MSQEKRHRNVAHLWADKRVLRFFRKHPMFRLLHPKQRGSLRSVYIALCEMDSDFGEGAIIKGFAKTVSTYSGLGADSVGQYLRALRNAGLVDYHQTREEGQFGQTGLVLFKWDEDDEEGRAIEIVDALQHRTPRKPLPGKAVTGETRGYKNPKGSNGKNPPKGGNKSTMATATRSASVSATTVTFNIVAVRAVIHYQATSITPTAVKRTLRPKDIRYFFERRLSSGQPTVYAVDGEQLFISGVPRTQEAGQLLQVHSWKEPDALATDAAVTVLPDYWDDVI
ncbi:hypothetical protein LCGC14_1598960, partial [marine sediment metagenome]